MSVKHIKQYYDQICKQYSEMLAELKDFEKEAEENLFPPEKLSNIKQLIDPLKVNYERWAFMMFLLNKPNRKEKEKAYVRRNKKLLSKLSKDNNLESVVSENEEVIKKLKTS